MDAETAVRRTLPIADAIAVANRRGVVHRDIKPENVFLARDEFGRIQPKLVDFGVARLRERGAALTRPGVLMGTPDYMAPEQARAEPDVDQRADVWAFAVVLYELMTGRRPFARENASYLAILKAIVSEPPVPIHSLGAGDAALWTILERALAKRPSDRYGGLRELGEALAGWLLARGVSEDAYGASLRTNWAMVSGASRCSTDSRAGGRIDPPTLPRAPDQAELAFGETLPPPAVPVPQLAPVVVTGEKETRARLFAKRPPRTLGRTLESASAERFTPLQIALASAFAAALATAGIGWAIVRAHLPPPPSVVSAPR
jgi:serine/threonine-protein kinase